MQDMQQPEMHTYVLYLAKAILSGLYTECTYRSSGD